MSDSTSKPISTSGLQTKGGYELSVEDELASHFASILDLLGYDDNPHTKDTPRRAARAWIELTQGEDFNATAFKNMDIDQMVVCQDIPFYSLCAHHMLPFFGTAHVAYIPGDNLLGLSKLARAVEHFSRGLSVQEELTKDVMDFLLETLGNPKGVAVVMQASHLCMQMRGVERTGKTTTSAMNGVFLDPQKEARAEFFNIINGGKHG